MGSFPRRRNLPGAELGSTSRTTALAALLALVLMACGGDADVADNGEGSETAASTEAGVTDEEIDLLVWMPRDYYIPPDKFASFEEEYPNINVEWDVQPNDDILQQMLRMKDAGAPLPDVIQDDTFLLPAFVDADLIGPHDELLQRWQEEDPELYDKLLPAAWDEAKIDGVGYGVAATANFDYFYYNVPWFEEAGVELPFESMEDVLEAMIELRKTRPESIPMSVQALAGEGVTALKAMLGAAGTEFEGAAPDLTSDGGLYIIDWYKRAQENGLLPAEAVSWGEAESRGAYITGDGGIIVEGPNTAADFLEIDGFDYGEDWAATPIPTSRTGDAEDGTLISIGRTYSVTTGSEHPYEASLILRYLTETDNLVDTVLDGATPPRQSEALDDERLNEFWPFFDGELKDAFIESRVIDPATNAGEVETVLEQLFGEIVAGTDKSAEELAEEYQAQLDEL